MIVYVPLRDSGAPPVTYQFRDTFDGASKDTALWLDPTASLPPPWTGATISGTDTQSGGAARITPTASGFNVQGRKTLAATYDLAVGQRLAMKWDPSSVAVNGMVVDLGFAQASNAFMRIRFERDGGSSILLTAVTFDAGSSTALSPTEVFSTIADYRWISLFKSTSTSITVQSAPDVSGSPGSWTTRHTFNSTDSGYIAGTDFYAAMLSTNQSSSATPSVFVLEEAYLTS